MPRSTKDAHDRDLRGLTREMLGESQVVMLLRHRAEMLSMPIRKPISAGELCRRLNDLIDDGDLAWPPPPWNGPTRPYAAGVAQHLWALVGTYGFLTDEGGTEFRLKKSTTERFPEWRQEQKDLVVLLLLCECGKRKGGAEERMCLDCRRERAADLLPHPPEQFQWIAHAYEARTGCPVAYGVTDDLVRVIRVRTLRGDLDHELADEMTWAAAVEAFLT